MLLHPSTQRARAGLLLLLPSGISPGNCPPTALTLLSLLAGQPNQAAAKPTAKMDEQGKFEFIKELGRGSFGSVVLARNTKTGEQVRLSCKLQLLQTFTCGPLLFLQNPCAFCASCVCNMLALCLLCIFCCAGGDQEDGAGAPAALCGERDPQPQPAAPPTCGAGVSCYVCI